MKRLIKFAKPKVADDPTDTFVMFLHNWDNFGLNNHKAVKAIFLDSLGKAFALYNIPTKKDILLDSKEAFQFDFKNVLEVAKENNAKAIIIAENAMRNEVDINENRYNLFTSLKKEAGVFGIDVKDLMSVHSRGYSSFRLEPLDA